VKVSAFSSTTVGLPKVKRDKFTVFNFLSFPGQELSETDNKNVEQSKDTSEPLEDKGKTTIASKRKNLPPLFLSHPV
jgi:hypothetical protein